jgi:hypothetical protein
MWLISSLEDWKFNVWQWTRRHWSDRALTLINLYCGTSDAAYNPARRFVRSTHNAGASFKKRAFAPSPSSAITG